MSSQDLLKKYEYLTGEDLGHKPSVFENAKFEYSPLGMLLSKAFKKAEVKSVAKSKDIRELSWMSHNASFCSFL